MAMTDTAMLNRQQTEEWLKARERAWHQFLGWRT